MTDLQVKYAANQEAIRHNLAQEEIAKQEAMAKEDQARASLQQAEAALKQAATAAEKSKWEREIAKWKNILQTIDLGFDAAGQMGWTPMGASEIGKNVGQGLGGIGNFIDKI